MTTKKVKLADALREKSKIAGKKMGCFLDRLSVGERSELIEAAKLFIAGEFGPNYTQVDFINDVCENGIPLTRTKMLTLVGRLKQGLLQ